MSEHADDAPHLENHTECVNRCYHNFSLEPLIRFLFISKHQAGKLLQEHYWPKLSQIAAGWKSKTDQNWAELDIQSRQPSIREEA